MTNANLQVLSYYMFYNFICICLYFIIKMRKSISVFCQKCIIKFVHDNC